MNQQKLQKLESRFQEIKQGATQAQWNSPDYLRNHAVDIENDDIELAFLLMQRAHNLRPEGTLIANKLEQYRNALTELGSQILVLNSLNQTTSNYDISMQNSPMSTQEDLELPSKKQIIINWLKKPISLAVILPWLLFTFYQVIWASPRFESHSQVIVRKPDNQATLDASMAVLTGLGVNSTNTDTELVEAYIYSNDMIIYLQESLNIFEHFNSSNADFFSRLPDWASKEDIQAYYLNHVVVEIDESSAVITIKTQGFTPEFAHRFNDELVKRAEWYINNIGHQLAQSQLTFIEGEHEITAKRLQSAKTDLLNFQQTYHLLDPKAEGIAMQQIAYSLEASLSAKKTELYALESIMSPDAPQVKSIRRVIESLENQLLAEKSRLTEHDLVEQFSVGEVMSQYTDFQVNVELALQAYTSSLISLEKSRIEAYRQLQFLVVIESPTLPEDNRYPAVLYNLSLFAVILLLLFMITKIITATIKELS